MKKLFIAFVILSLACGLGAVKVKKIGIHPKVVTVTDNRYTFTEFENSSATDTNARGAAAATIAEAVTLLDGHGGVIYVENETGVDADLTIPSNVKLILLPSAVFRVASTKTLTFNCVVEGTIVNTGSGSLAYGASYEVVMTNVSSSSPTFTTVTGANFNSTLATATDQDVGAFTYGTWTDDGSHDKNITGQTAHFVPFQANISADTAVAKDIAAARFRVNTGINTTGAIGNLQLRQKISHNVASAAILNASTSIAANTTVGTGSILGGYFSIEGSGVITKAGDNDCTPLVAVNNNTGGGIDNVLVALQNGTGTNVDEIVKVGVTNGTASAGLAFDGTMDKGIDFSQMVPDFGDSDDAFIAVGTWNDKYTVTGQLQHFVPIQVNLSSASNVTKDIAAARLRVDNDLDTTGAIGCLQLRQDLAENVGSSAALNASVNISDAVVVGTGSVLGGYFSIEGAGAITKAGPNDCTPLVAVNNNTSNGSVDNAFVALQNGTGTTVQEVILAGVTNGTATAGVNIENSAGTLTTGLKLTGTIGTDISLQNGETLDNALDGTIACSGAFTTGGAGAKTTAGNVAVENAVGSFHTTTFTLTNVALTVTAAGAGVGFGNVQLYDFPEGYLYMIGVVGDLSLTDTVSAGAEMAGNFLTWTPAGNWATDGPPATKWSHTTGDATALTTDVVPVAGTTYTVSVTLATTTAGGGVVVAMGGIAQSEVHSSATETWTFTASDATALTLTPASGTWEGDITAVSVTSVSPVSATWNGDIAFGTTADADGSLAGTELNLVPKTSTPAATAGVATADCVSTATEHAIIDGHSSASDLYLNLLIDAADFIDAGTGALHVNGTITVTWIKLGDN